MSLIFDARYSGNLQSAKLILLKDGFSATRYIVAGYKVSTTFVIRHIMYHIKSVMTAKDILQSRQAAMEQAVHTLSHQDTTLCNKYEEKNN